MAAFSVNRLGLDGPPFPLSFNVREADGSWLIDATAAEAAELADLLVMAAQETIVVVDLATNTFLDEDYTSWRPSRIAAEQGVRCEAHSLGWLASGVVGLSDEVLVLHRDELPRFLADWYPYELTLIDAPAWPTPERLDEMALAIGTADHTKPLLPELAGSRLYFSGHDDCYVILESTDSRMPTAILSRLLAAKAGSAASVEVPEPDATIVAAMIAQSAHWVGTIGAESAESVTVDLAAVSQRWRPSQPLPDSVDLRATYDLSHGTWHFQ